MELTHDQKQAMYTDGFAHFPGIVPRELVDNALRAINASLGDRGMHPDELPTLRSRSYAPEAQNAPAITDLLTASPLWGVAESGIGVGQIRPVSAGQIALRFPAMGPARTPHPHIDGMYSPTNGVPQGEIRNFTALIGVFLSDVPTDGAGNFTVWPGSHRLNAEYFRREGPQALLNGMPQVELPAPKQIHAKAGDAVLAHYALSHGIAGNASPHIRYAIFFRLTHVDHDAMKWESMTDIWREWAGMQDATREAAGAAR